jgi:hypothetical protein
MSFFDDASLVMIPSGYKDQKVYSVKPTDGTGDLTFSRASSATRVQSDGLIEKVRTNLYTYSEQFDNAAYTKTNLSVTANASTAPNGTTTADKVIPNATSSFHPIGQALTGGVSGAEYAFSVYAKADGYNYLLINTSAGAAVNAGPLIDLTNGTIIGNLGGTTYGAQVESVGSGWYRISFSYATNATSTSVDLNVLPTSTIAVYSGDGTSGVLFWGAQYEVGVATDYIATTTAAVSVGPVSGLPRLDYLGSTCPRLLLEPQRSNLALYSEQFDNAAWTKSNITVTANAAISPDGYTNADLLNFTSVSNYIDQSGTIVSGTTYTVSCYVKSAVASAQSFKIYGNANKTSDFLSATQEWQRFSYTFTADSTAMSAGLVSSSLIQIYVYGFQLEAGASATSYIPTLGASVTRVADAASKTGISSLIGQTEGVLFVDYNYQANRDTSGSMPIVIRSGSSEAYIFITTAGALRFELYNAGVLQALITGTIGAVGRKKIAFAYKSNDFAAYMNGVQIGIDTSGTVGAMAAVHIGSYYVAGYSSVSGISQALLFKTRLTNAQLAELTA